MNDTTYTVVMALLGVLVIADLVLKMVYAWKAARNNQKWWFVALLVFNTVGVLPLVYLAFFQKDKNK